MGGVWLGTMSVIVELGGEGNICPVAELVLLWSLPGPSPRGEVTQSEHAVGRSLEELCSGRGALS